MSNTNLPIESIRDDLVRAAVTERRVVLSAPTGSGKSTQVPQMLLDGGCIPDDKKIIVLQPRRLAARLLANRVASERSGQPGGEVGFHIRFERKIGPNTRILFVTEGILLRMMLSDPGLKDIAAIVFDEFHERHLYSDLGIAMARQLQESERPDLSIVVMSATLDVDALADYLQPCVALKAEGRTYPITMSYSAAAAKVAEAPVWDAVAHHFTRLANEHPEGDMLVFMPGSYEIQRTVQAIQAERAARDWVVLPLYGELPPRDQDAAVAQYDRRKVVVATNVAETSITIDGITLVIDAGLARIARFDPHRGINTLLIEKISQAAAEQRAGRCGRTAPGHCLRLWSEKEQAHRPVREAPEVKRIDLSETVLALKLHGVESVADFPWFEKPEEKSLHRAVGLLRDLGALDSNENLTEIGRRMAQFPVNPRYARMLLAAEEYNCVWHICLIAALTQVRRIVLPLRDRRRNEEREELFGESKSDFFHALRAWGMARRQKYDNGFCRKWGIHGQSARQVEKLANQFVSIAEGQGLEAPEKRINEDSVRRCLLLGFADQLAKRDSRATLNCSLVHGRRGELRRDSAIRDASLFVAAEIDEMENRGSVAVLLSMATEIEEEWLEELFPDDVAEKSLAQWDHREKRVTAKRVRMFRDLVLEEKESGEPEPGDVASILTGLVLEGRAELKKWDERVEKWIARVNFAGQRLPDLGIPHIDDEGRRILTEQVCDGAMSLRDLRDADPWPALRSWLSNEQRMAMDSLCPETFKLPGRSKLIELRYEADNDRVILSSKLQDFYDVPASALTIGGGQIPLTIEMLAPNRRPCQLTSDITAFWENSYEGIKKELKGRYPKHEWR